MRKSLKGIVGLVGLAIMLAGCGGDGGGLSNGDPGNNDVNVVACFGDSITMGNQCACEPYPGRLSRMIGKSCVNLGIGGSQAVENVGRCQEAIDKYHPGFMIILYGVNDIIHGGGIGGIVGALGSMVDICKANHVVPVLMTYPKPTASHIIFGARTLALNNEIRALASSKGVAKVDLQGEFSGNPEWYEPDGLHPNSAGTDAIALAVADLF
jgi:lysophospholipase L1-like esterase